MFDRYRRIQERRAASKGDESGFTLIELLIVIVVLGILAGVVVFALGNVTATSAQSACNSDAKTVETAVEAYHANTGVYPPLGIAGGVGGAGQSQLVTVPGVGTTVVGQIVYLRSWPTVNASRYLISVVAGTGEVDVTPVTNNVAGTAQNYDTQSAATLTPSTIVANGCFAVH